VRETTEQLDGRAPIQRGSAGRSFTAMETTPRTHVPAGGDGLLFLIAIAIVAVVSVEALFIAFSSWWLMSGVLLFAIAAAAGVATALVRLMDDDEPAVLQPVASEKAAAARPARRPYTAPAVRPLPPG
jgi:hypothetical protein